MTPSNANTSGLEVVAWRKMVWVADGIGTGWMLSNQQPEPSHQPTDIEPLVTAASAQARIAELEGELEEARTIDAGFWAWLGERDLQPDGPDVEWGDIVVALTEHVDNAYDIADKATARATAAEARADRLAKALRKSREGWANALELGLLPPQHEETAADLRDEASAALQQSASPLPEGGGDGALIAELKEARGLLTEWIETAQAQHFDAWFDDDVKKTSDFLARKGKGEG